MLPCGQPLLELHSQLPAELHRRRACHAAGGHIPAGLPDVRGARGMQLVGQAASSLGATMPAQRTTESAPFLVLVNTPVNPAASSLLHVEEWPPALR